MISRVAMNRICEQESAANKHYRKKIAGRPLRSHAKDLTDDELLAKLRSFNVEVTQPMLEELSKVAPSADVMTEALFDQSERESTGDRFASDWVWICLTELWLRWFPDEPSFEMLDDKIQAGYELLDNQESAAGCRLWLDAWKDVLGLLDKAGTRRIDELDRRFGGTQSVFNWLQDLDGELWNAAFDDRQLLNSRVELCEEGLRRLEDEDPIIIENRGRALAESYFELGESDKADALFREWLKTDPRWGWGWIGWSDCYHYSETKLKDLNRAEEILKEGMSVKDVRDVDDIEDRLADLYLELGRVDEASEIQTRLKRRIVREVILDEWETDSDNLVLHDLLSRNLAEEEVSLDELSSVRALRLMQSEGCSTMDHGASRSRPKVGRNQPCPCGSGKKFKKCCG